MKNINYIIIVILFLIFSCSKKSQKEKPGVVADSLAIFLSNAESENFQTPQRIYFAKKAFEILSTRNNDSVYRNSLYNVSRQFYVLKQNKELQQALSLVLKKSQEQRDSTNIAKAYYLKGNHCINEGQNDSAFFYLLKSEKLFRKLNDSLNLGKNYVDKAFVQLFESDYTGCEISSIQGLAFLKNYDVKQSEYDAYNLIGISSNELKNYENALTYHQKALKIASAKVLSSKNHYEASSKNNIGVVYQNMNKHGEAIKYFQSALNERDLLRESPAMYAMLTDNLAYSKFKLKEFINLPELFFQSLKIREENKMFSGVIANKIHLSEFFAEKEDTINAQKYAHEALNLAKTTKISGDLLGSLKQLAVVEHKNSSRYSKEYIKINDSLQQEERIAKNRFARIAFETDEIIMEKDKLAEQNRSLLYFFVGTLFIGILLFVIRAQRARNRELLLVQAQQKANEDIYNLMISQQATIEENRVKEKKRIAQELHDGVLGRLFGARLNLDSLNRSIDEESINNRFNYLSELKNIEQDIREISHDLNREKYVLINNFVAIVNNLLEEQKSSFEPNLTFNIDEEIKWDSVNNAIKINLYRIIQESLQNINKYAHAKHILVEFKKENGNIRLKISDDGSGFEVEGKKKGIGLQNMLSRVNECNGAFDIKSKKGKGTTIVISVPSESMQSLI